MKNNIVLNDAQMAELNAYIRKAGRKWRLALSDDWYYCRPSGLIWLRNSPGGHEFIRDFRYTGDFERGR